MDLEEQKYTVLQRLTTVIVTTITTNYFISFYVPTNYTLYNVKGSKGPSP